MDANFAELNYSAQKSKSNSLWIQENKQHASGYAASHIINKYQFLYSLVPDKNDNLELVEANLSEKSCWLSAVKGCEYVFHVASPIPPYVPKDEMELIGPTVAGTVNVLEAAVSEGVKKIVVTSSTVAISVGNEERLLSEADWSDENKCGAYPKSKVKAEKAAWEFYERNKDKIEMTVVNPALILGPIFTKHGNSSETLVVDILSGAFPGVMNFKVGLVDLRDVAEAHYKAMFNEETNGKRYICSCRLVSLEEIITVLKQEFGKYGYQIQDKHVTAEEVIASGYQVAQRQLGMIGKDIKLTNEKSVQELNVKYRPCEETVVDMAYSLIKQGLVVDKTKGN